MLLFHDLVMRETITAWDWQSPVHTHCRDVTHTHYDQDGGVHGRSGSLLFQFGVLFMWFCTRFCVS